MNPVSSQDCSESRVPAWLAPAAMLLFVAAFQALWFRERIFQTGDSPETRLARWRLALSPELYAPLFEQLPGFWPPAFLAERVGPFVFAATLWTIARFLGGAALRWLTPNASMSRWERWAASAGLGMAAASLVVQGFGLLSLLNRLSIAVAASAAVILAIVARRGGPTILEASAAEERPSWLERFAISTACASTLGLATLAASTPTPDYDAQAYHLLAPKEHFLAGRIEFLPHNVYATFPFLTEMFHLLGMVALGDWFQGGLAGQVALAGFGFLGTVGVAIAACRLFGPCAGWCAALVYATTPWTYRLTAIPYVEGAMLAYFSLALWAALRCGESPFRWGLLCGLFAGAAFGCKYPAAAMIAPPAAAVAAAAAQRRGVSAALLACAIGFLCLAGPWLLRNVAWTGNPVYPLAYERLGGGPWSTEKNERFAKAHQSADFGPSQAASYARDVVTRSDWQGALVFAFAPLALLNRRWGWAALFWMLVVYVFLVFFYMTHRLDRFFLPVEPLAAILAGGGMARFAHALGRRVVWLVVAPAVVFQFFYCSTPLCGMNRYTLPAAEARRIATASASEALLALNESGIVQPTESVLFVGLAAVYYFPAKARYNTVFDDNLLERIAASPGRGAGLRTAQEIRDEFRRRRIDYVFVDWSWIDRYRSPGNYGFPDFVQRKTFAELVRESVLRPVWPAANEGAFRLYKVVHD